MSANIKKLDQKEKKLFKKLKTENTDYSVFEVTSNKVYCTSCERHVSFRDNFRLQRHVNLVSHKTAIRIKNVEELYDNYLENKTRQTIGATHSIVTGIRERVEDVFKIV